MKARKKRAATWDELAEFEALHPISALNRAWAQEKGFPILGPSPGEYPVDPAGEIEKLSELLDFSLKSVRITAAHCRRCADLLGARNSSSTDISATKSAREALESSEESLKKAVEIISGLTLSENAAAE